MARFVSRIRRAALTLTVALVLGGGSAVSAAAPVAADYGNTAVYQIEISANSGGPSGGGAWLWIELNSSGTGDYVGSDCGHGFGALSDQGDVTAWSSANGMLTIQGVALFGGAFPVTITVPSAFGNYSETPLQVFGLPFPGFAVVEVAP
jgi:hypothetical protein